jgi:hypothetical protein
MAVITQSRKLFMWGYNEQFQARGMALLVYEFTWRTKYQLSIFSLRINAIFPVGILLNNYVFSAVGVAPYGPRMDSALTPPMLCPLMTHSETGESGRCIKLV